MQPVLGSYLLLFGVWKYVHVKLKIVSRVFFTKYEGSRAVRLISDLYLTMGSHTYLEKIIALMITSLEI